MTSTPEVLAALRIAAEYQKAVSDALTQAHKQCGATASMEALRLLNSSCKAEGAISALFYAIEQDAAK